LRNLGVKVRRILVMLGVIALLSVGFAFLQAQSAGTTNPGSQASGQSAPQRDQNIPDAPSTVQPAKPLPTSPSTQAPPNNAPAEEPQAPPQQTPTQGAPEQAPPANENATPATQGTNQKPPVNIRTVPEGGATKETTPGQDDIPNIFVQTNQVVIPVTVTDEAGHLVPGLTAKDFTVLENGKKQKLNLFTSDPFAISAAVIIDLGMKDVDLQKVNRTFPSLEGAFSAFDELAIYTYSNTVSRLTGWGAVGPALTAKLDELENVRGENNGPPVTSGPIAAGGPVINGVPVDPGQPRTIGAPQPARVMNDAILRAATDLAKRDKTRRKVIFVISDGREYRSDASYRDVLRVLLSNNIMVYALGVSSGVPGYRTLSKLHLPRFGYSDILPKYVNATTGGQVFNEMTRTGIEDAYSEAMGNARNQYTLGYKTNLPPSGGYRTFEILVDRPSCRSSIRPCVNVEAPDGYYPTPPVR
jgi:VWFA-related protein